MIDEKLDYETRETISILQMFWAAALVVSFWMISANAGALALGRVYNPTVDIIGTPAVVLFTGLLFIARGYDTISGSSWFTQFSDGMAKLLVVILGPLLMLFNAFNLHTTAAIVAEICMAIAILSFLRKGY